MTTNSINFNFLNACRMVYEEDLIKFLHAIIILQSHSIYMKTRDRALNFPESKDENGDGAAATTLDESP